LSEKYTDMTDEKLRDKHHTKSGQTCASSDNFSEVRVKKLEPNEKK